MAKELLGSKSYQTRRRTKSDFPISKAQLQAAISEIIRKEQARAPSAQPADAEISNLRRTLVEQRLQPEFAKAGFDLDKLKEVVKQHQTDVDKIIAKERKRADKNFSVTDNFASGIENKRKALQQIAGLPLIVTPVVVDKPFSIYAVPSSILEDSNLEAGGWAKVLHGNNKDVGFKSVRLSFFFAWQNPSDYFAVINAYTDVLFRGRCTVHATPGFFTASDVSLNAFFALWVYFGESVNTGGSVSLKSLNAWASAGIIGGDAVTKTSFFNDWHSIGRGHILVQDKQLVVFEIRVWFNYEIDSGSVLINFEDADFNIACPFLVVELLTPPAVTAGAYPHSPVIGP